MLRKGMFLADRYEIIEQIGTGGMSDVYKAKCHKLNRYVAIKVMKSEFSEDKTFVSKFRAEAQSVAGFTHPNVVNVYDVGDENGVYYIVLDEATLAIPKSVTLTLPSLDIIIFCGLISLCTILCLCAASSPLAT